MQKIIDPPITASVIRRIKPGCEQAVEKLAQQVAEEAMKYPGYLGTNLFRPTSVEKEYHVIFKFDCMSHYHQWEKSTIRASLYEKIRPLLVEPPYVHILTGLETWFELPAQGVLKPPPRYKMALVSWMAIYPLVILILEILKPVLSVLPIPVRAALITLIAIPTMTYFLMPRMTTNIPHINFKN